MTTTDININSIAARLAHRTPLFVCDCGKRAQHAVSKVEGARVITATVCHECKKVWEETK